MAAGAGAPDAARPATEAEKLPGDEAGRGRNRTGTMEGLGEYLKHGRQEAGLSLEDLAGRTRIRLENLERLEDGDLAALPTDTYVRGFVRLVCKELGLPADEGIERYEMLRASRAPTDEMVWSAETEPTGSSRLEKALRDPERVVGIARGVGLGLAALVVVIVLVAGGRFVAGMLADRGDRELAAAGAPAESAEPSGAADSGEPVDEVEVQAEVPGEEVAAEPVAPTPAPEPQPMRLALAEVEVTRGEPGIRPGSGDYDPAAATDVAGAQEDSAPSTTQDSPGAPEAERAATEDTTPEPEPMRLALAEVEVTRAEPGIQPGSGDYDPTGETDLAAAQEDSAPATVDAEPEPQRVSPAAADATPVPEPERTTPTAADATPQPEPERSPVSTVEVTPQPAAAAATETTRPREIVGSRAGSARLELEVEALRAVEFSVLLDGIGRARTRSMQAGERRIWKAQDLFVITADDGGAIRLRLSGEDLGIAGTDGVALDGLRVRRR